MIGIKVDFERPVDFVLVLAAAAVAEDEEEDDDELPVTEDLPVVAAADFVVVTLEVIEVVEATPAATLLDDEDKSGAELDVVLSKAAETEEVVVTGTSADVISPKSPADVEVVVTIFATEVSVVAAAEADDALSTPPAAPAAVVVVTAPPITVFVITPNPTVLATVPLLALRI